MVQSQRCTYTALLDSHLVSLPVDAYPLAQVVESFRADLLLRHLDLMPAAVLDAKQLNLSALQ